MSKIQRVIFGVVVVCLLGASALGAPWAGSGTAGDPYQIWDACDMQAIGADSNYWDAHFELCADIDLSAYTGTSYNIIGNNVSAFTGVFDGNGHTISNFTYDSNGEYYIGLFGYLGTSYSAEIKDLGLIGVNINAGVGYTGSLAGYLGNGSISRCYVEGGIISGDYIVGGLLGVNHDAILNCYAADSVSGTSAGGLVGSNGMSAKISNCYSIGVVLGDENVGGLVGVSGGIVQGSYWDIETSGQSSSAGGRGKTTAEMQTASTFVGWGCDGAWTIDDGNDYPRLVWENKLGELITNPSYLTGSGTEGDPYLVYTAEQLNTIGLIACDWDKHFKLMADINLSCYTGDSFNIIGNGTDAFTGVFDGNGFSIYNFTYTSTIWRDDIGIFGFVNSLDAEIKDLVLVGPNVVSYGDRMGLLIGQVGYCKDVNGCSVVGGEILGGWYVGGLIGKMWEGIVADCRMEDCNISGMAYVGGLIGRVENESSINNCHIQRSNISGENRVGGLIASAEEESTTINNCSVEDGNVSNSNPYNTGDYGGGLVALNYYGVSISNSHYTGKVSGYSTMGGLAGSSGGTIFKCYSTGDFSGGDEQVGGLVGSNSGEVSYCYSLGTVSSSVWSPLNYYGAGGLVGFNYGGSISNCCYIGAVSGVSGVGGLAGYNYDGFISNSCSLGSVSGNSYIGGLVGYSNGGTYEHCYSASYILATSSAGGLIGKAWLELRPPYYRESCTKCFWDSDVNPDVNGIGNATDPNVIGKTTAEMQTISTFTDAGWDFVGEMVNGPNDIWDICEGMNYPKLSWQIPPVGDFICPDGVTMADFSYFAYAWLSDPNYPNWDPNCDISQPNDGVIDEQDLAVFVENWLEGL